jgi:hypothetical protein
MMQEILSSLLFSSLPSLFSSFFPLVKSRRHWNFVSITHFLTNDIFIQIFPGQPNLQIDKHKTRTFYM